jgi:hypothetical protein
MTTKYVQSSKQVHFICGNCKNALSFTPSVPIISDTQGHYSLINAYGKYSQLQAVHIKYEKFFQTTENKEISDIISVQCPHCGIFSSFAIAVGVIERYVNGKSGGVLLIKNNNAVHELPIVLLQRLADNSFLPLCIMDMFVDKEE